MTTKIFQGERRDLLATVLQDDGSRYDLTGIGVEWVAVTDGVRVKKTTENGGITVLDAVSGRLAIHLTPEDTSVSGHYTQEMRVTGPDLRITVLQQQLWIRPSLFGGDEP